MTRLTLTFVLLSKLVLAQNLSPPFEGAQEPCYDTAADGVQGWCEHSDCCAYDYYISDLCPDYPLNVIPIISCIFPCHACNCAL